MILREYPLRDFESPALALSQGLTDGSFSCMAQTTNPLLSIFTPTFAYEFADRDSPQLFVPPVSFPYRATHTNELQFVFTDLLGPSRLTPAERQLATTMKAYWTDFADDGNPNALFGQTPIWPRFTILDPNVQSLVAPRPRPDLGFAIDHKCAFWTGILVQGTALSVLTAHGG